MRRRLRRLNRVLVTIETALAGGLALAVTGVVLLQVLMRYLLAEPNPWSEEVSRFCFVWMSLLGASLAVEHRKHFRFDQLSGALPPRIRRGVEAGARLVVLLFAGLLVASGGVLMELTLGQRSAALGLPVALVYAAAPASGLLMLIHLLAAPAEDRS